ncbi:hypothetical protein GN956_G3505 [Arapaima gigas]
MTAVDVEALHPSSGRRSAGLRLCLLVSAGALLACLLGVSVTATLLVLRIQSDLDKVSGRAQHGGEQLRKTSHLGNITLEWSSQNLGSRFNYSEKTGSLEVTEGGMYLMYLNLGVRCPHEAVEGCAETSVAVNVKDTRSSKLECRLELPKSHLSLKAHHCLGAVMLQSHDRVLVNMKVMGDSRHWKLDQRHTRFGLVPVGRSTA